MLERCSSPFSPESHLSRRHGLPDRRTWSFARMDRNCLEYRRTRLAHRSHARARQPTRIPLDDILVLLNGFFDLVLTQPIIGHHLNSRFPPRCMPMKHRAHLLFVRCYRSEMFCSCMCTFARIVRTARNRGRLLPASFVPTGRERSVRTRRRSQTRVETYFQISIVDSAGLFEILDRSLVVMFVEAHQGQSIADTSEKASSIESSVGQRTVP